MNASVHDLNVWTCSLESPIIQDGGPMGVLGRFPAVPPAAPPGGKASITTWLDCEDRTDQRDVPQSGSIPRVAGKAQFIQ